MDLPEETVQLVTLAAALRDIRSNDPRNAKLSGVGYLCEKPQGLKLNRAGAAALDALAELVACAPNQ